MLDALQYANWTVDYVKDDGCGGCHGTDPDPALASYAAMQSGISQSQREILLSTEASKHRFALFYASKTEHLPRHTRDKHSRDSTQKKRRRFLQENPHHIGLTMLLNGVL
eukprot:COSAG06_NODE_304_length_17855_cov_47.399414_1_plen_109_part_10